MRLAYVSTDPGVPVWGRKGCSIHVQEVLQALRRAGVETALLTSRAGGEPPASLASVEVKALPSLPKGDPADRERAALAANSGLQTALEHTPCDAIYERHALWSFAAMEFARRRGIPGVLEVNAPLVDEQSRHRALLDRDGAERAANRAFDAASAIVAVSDELAAWLETQPAARGKIQVIPNGIDPARFPDGLKPSSSVTGLTVGFVGTLKPWHGLSILVEAFARFEAEHPGSRLLIVGDGPERAALESDIAARGLRETVQFTGLVSPEAVPAWIASMDIAVAPYPAATNFYFSPLKVYEYMAAARATVASGIGQLKQLITHGQTGWLVPPGDAGALAAALAHLAAAAPLRRRLGANARALVLRQHTWDAAVGKILGLLQTPAAVAP